MIFPRVHRPALETFSSCDIDLRPVILTFAFDTGSIKMNQCGKCLDQRSITKTDVTLAILSRNIVARQSCSTQLCISHTATLSHKQEMTKLIGYFRF